MLIDTDGMEGYASLRALERELGPLPETPTVLSGGGGSHMLFRHPGRHVPTAKGLRECIDIRGDGGISIMPPSIHEFGQYEWECDLSLDDLDFADLPPAWVQFITTPVSGNGPAGINAGDIQWQPADDGSILVTDGRETYMRNVIWKELHAMMQQTGQIPSAADLATRAAAEYMPHVDHGRPGRGLDELIRKCEAAVAKAKRQPDLIVPPKRGLTRPFLIR